MTVTVFIRYQLDPFKRADFEAYLRTRQLGLQTAEYADKRHYRNARAQQQTARAEHRRRLPRA